jgi:hypothetical protein
MTDDKWATEKARELTWRTCCPKMYHHAEEIAAALLEAKESGRVRAERYKTDPYSDALEAQVALLRNALEVIAKHCIKRDTSRNAVWVAGEGIYAAIIEEALASTPASAAEHLRRLEEVARLGKDAIDGHVVGSYDLLSAALDALDKH